MDARRFKSSIKTKVLLGFGFAILILLTAGVISYQSINDLMKSVDILSMPDDKLIKLNDILSDLSVSENHIRSYFISREKKYLDQYKYYSEKVEKNISSLSLLTNDYRNDSNKINKISILWLEKRTHTQKLINLYQKRREAKLPERFLKKLNGPNSEIPTIIITKIITIRTIDHSSTAIANKGKAQYEEKPSLWEKLFKRKDKEDASVDTLLLAKPVNIKETKTTIDTVYSKKNFNNAIDNEGVFVKMYTKLKDQNFKSRKVLNDNENEIIQKDIALITYIRGIVVDLRNKEQGFTEKNVSEAKKILEASLIKILLFGLSGISAILLFVFMIMNDVTKSNYHKSQLVNAKIQAEDLAKTKEDFLATMSHEIRTPLNSIIGFTEQLSQTKLQNRQKYFLQAVSTSSEHLLSLVNDILDLSRIEAGKIDFEETPFNLKNLIEDVNDAFYITASEKKITLSYSLKGKETMLIGDPFRLKQILFNLISNAIKFTDAGSIHVLCEEKEVTEADVTVLISVKDTGIGIPQDKLENIFELFSQADSSITRKYGGTGLGLAISKKITESQGGKIYVKSEEGKGSEFSIELRCKKNKGYQSLPSYRQPSDFKIFRGIKILVVEDDEFNLLLFHTILTKWNMKVSIASNGEEAIQMLEKDSFDIVITDIQMPGISGIGLLQNIKSHTRKEISDLPVVAITANVIKEPMESHRFSGFNDILLKPFKEDDLARVITKGCEVKSGNSILANNTSVVPFLEKHLFSDFIAFSGGDMSAVQAMIAAFINNYFQQLEKINSCFEDGDWGGLKELAHRLIPGFGHLQNHEMVTILQNLEIYLEKEKNPDKSKLQKILADILRIGANQIKELETERIKIF